MELFNDKSLIVKQAAGIALGFLHQKSHPGVSKESKEAFDILVKEVDNKNSHKTIVFGCLIGLGLMFSGGQNTQIKLLNEKNQLLIKNFIGVYFFLQYFYWYPLVNFLSLSLESEYIAVVDQNLELVQGTKIAYEKEQK